MRTSRFFTSLLFILAVLLMTAGTILAADPGIPVRDDIAIPESGPSDQKPGSVLFYNVYSSSATQPATENTRINITNTGTRTVGVHLYFIEGSSCSPADATICLTTNQTSSFRASDFDPGTIGFLVAVAIDPTTGCPIDYDFLIGDEFVKFSTGHDANLAAIGVIARSIAACDPNTTTLMTLNFDGVLNATDGAAHYDRLPSVVAIDNIPSRLDSNDTLVIINRPTGNLAVGTDAIGSIFGLLYNDAENSASFQLSSNQCQLRFSISNSIPRTVPRFTQFVPSGRSAWVKLYSITATPLIGAYINYNSGAGAAATAFSGGHNMHHLRLSPSASLIVPVFPPNCG